MALMVEELIASPNNEVRPSKTTRSNNVKVVRNATLLEALAKGGSVTSYTTEDGKVKIKIVVKKQDLKQMLETMNNNDVNSTILPKAFSSSIEKRLYDLMKMKKACQVKENQPNHWRPALQSIPEEH